MTAKQAKDLASPISKLCDKVLNVRLGQLNAWKGESFAQAGVFGVNFLLDDFTPKLERSVRRGLEDAGVKAPYQDARYKAYFPESLSLIIGKALRSQLAVTRPMLAQLRAEKTESVAAHLPMLESLVKQGTTMLELQQTAEAERRNHRNHEIKPLFEEINKARKVLYGTLTTREAERGLPAGWALSFFRKVSRTEDDPAEQLQDALFLILKARGLTLSKEGQKKISEQYEQEVLQRWIGKAVTVTTEAELFA
jgi:hypothetical protein